MNVVMITDFPDDLDHPGGGLEAAVVSLTRGLGRTRRRTHADALGEAF